jgi:hypothetical protein
MRTTIRNTAVLTLITAAACTGATSGEREPGSDVHLEGGAIAVDHRTETVFVLQTLCDEPNGPTCEGMETKTLHVVGADTGAPLEAIDVTGLDDLRILFPTGAVLVMGEPSNTQEELRLLDPNTLAERVRTTVDARYRGTRMSQSGRWLAVGDNATSGTPIHVIDTSTNALETEVLPHDGSWLEAMWLKQADELMAIVFVGNDARILSWTMEQKVSDDFETEGSYWASPNRDITVPDTQRDLLFSYTWVGVAPGDGLAVFPVRQGDEHVLLVLDLETDEVRTVADARGPVAFSPDGSTIVSYRYVDDGGGGTQPELLLVDPETLDTTSLEIPFTGGPQYFVSREGHHVVVAASLGTEQLVLYDLDTQEMTELDGPAIGLHEFVSRLGHDELWLVDDGLHRLDFLSATLETVPLDWTPAHINIQRTRDQLVMDDVDESRLRFWSPASREVVRDVLLPEPLM